LFEFDDEIQVVAFGNWQFQVATRESIILTRKIWGYVEDPRDFAFGGGATMSALRKQGCPALPSAGPPGVDHRVAFALAAIPLPPMQRAASGFFLSPQASQGNRNRRR
jgi:hypothetical protein